MSPSLLHSVLVHLPTPESFVLRKAFRFRLRPTPAVRQRLAQMAGCTRFLYNKALALNLNLLEQKQPILRYTKLCSQLQSWKQEEATLWLQQAHSQVLQQALKNLDRAFQDGLDVKQPGKKMPRFKKRGRQDSFRYPQGFKLRGNRVYLPKIGWVGMFKSQEVEGTIKNVTVSREGEHWFVSIQTEQEVRFEEEIVGGILGVDLGVVHQLTQSDGVQHPPVEAYRQAQQRLRREQRTLSRRVKGSNNWHKQVRRIRRLHQRISNLRKDVLHKLSHTLSQNHAVVCVEDLKVKNMTKSAKGTVESPGRNVKAKGGLNKAILEQGWGEFVRQLEYKLRWKGGRLVKVNPAYSSQECHACGFRSGENRKSQHEFECGSCGWDGNADVNGALNILHRGWEKLCEENVPVDVGCKPVEGEGVGLPVKQEPVGNCEEVPLR